MTGKNHRPPGTRNEPMARDYVRSDGKIGGYELPEGVLPQGEDWHPATRRWWDHWRRAPQGVRMMTEPDWDYLLDTALLHHQMWMSGGKNSERAAEIRMRVAGFGATPGDRVRLRMEIEIPSQYPVGNLGENVSDIDARRRRLTANSQTRARDSRATSDTLTESQPSATLTAPDDTSPRHHPHSQLQSTLRGVGVRRTPGAAHGQVTGRPQRRSRLDSSDP